MTTFSDLGLPRAVTHQLARLGITQPFPIQEAAIPRVLERRDVLGRGPTGSGKTFAFGLPMLTLLAGAPSRPGRPRGLVLVPTRELALQVEEKLADVASVLGLRVLAVVGGVNIKRHVAALAAPVDLLIATPGRAQDLIANHHLSFDDVALTTLDEADQMADMGFLPQVTKLLDRTPRGGQRLFFSATLDNGVDTLVARYLHDPVTCATAPPAATVATMRHYVVHVGPREMRNEVVLRIGARAGKTVMFMRTKHGVDRQVKKLVRVGIPAVGLHGDKGQNTRQNALAAFADGSASMLVATDIAARGIDISDVDLVVHVDPPAEHKAYVHRAGRTARAGADGTVVTLVMDGQEKETDALLRKAGVTAERIAATADSPELSRITGAQEPPGPRRDASPPTHSRKQRATRDRNSRQHRSSGSTARGRTASQEQNFAMDRSQGGPRRRGKKKVRSVATPRRPRNGKDGRRA